MFENKSAKHGDIAIGIDIGTTTISASVIDLTAKKDRCFYGKLQRKYYIARFFRAIC